MGFSISWVAVQGMSKAQALELLGFKDTGIPDETNASDFSGAELPDGWYLVFSNDYAFLDRDRLEAISAGCRIMACNVEEHVMASGAYFFESGREVWTIEHESEQGIFHLDSSGAMPPHFDRIRERLFQQQNNRGGEGSNVDYIFDVPVEVAREVCSFRHDLWDEKTRLKFSELTSR